MIKPRFRAWYGGECPVEWDTAVQVVMRGGLRHMPTQAGVYRWNHWETPEGTGDITAYRVIQEGE